MGNQEAPMGKPHAELVILASGVAVAGGHAADHPRVGWHSGHHPGRERRQHAVASGHGPESSRHPGLLSEPATSPERRKSSPRQGQRHANDDRGRIARAAPPPRSSTRSARIGRLAVLADPLLMPVTVYHILNAHRGPAAAGAADAPRLHKAPVWAVILTAPIVLALVVLVIAGRMTRSSAFQALEALPSSP